MVEEGEKYWKKNYGGSSTVQGYVYNESQAKALTANLQGKNCGEELGKAESFPGCDATFRILEVMRCKCSAHHIELHLIIKNLIKTLTKCQESKPLEFYILHSFLAETFREA